MDTYSQAAFVQSNQQPEASPEGFGSYGAAQGFADPDAIKPPKKSFPRGRAATNILGIVTCLLLPCVVFTVVNSLMTFSAHYNNAHLVHLVCGLLLVVIGILGLLAGIVVSRKVGRAQERAWLMFLFVTSLAAWIAACAVGDWNYEANMRPYYDLQQLNVYASVDPATYSGVQLMDAGRIAFTPGTHLDIKRSIGFKNLDTYCVAPVVGTGAGAANVSSYDFWAVGMNCCSGQGPDFKCGEWDNAHALAGLRLVNEDQQSYFRLAVQQAEAAYNIQARHPIFMYWLQDPLAEVNAYQDDGSKYFLLGIFCFFLLQLLLVVCVAVIFSKVCS